MNPPVRIGGGRTNLEIAAAVGLAVGAVLGLAGTLVASAPLRQLLWTIDGVGLVVATALMAVRYLRIGNDLVAAGFLVFAIGQGIINSSNSAGLQASVPSFGGGASMWAAGLAIVSIPKVFPNWVRIVGIVAAILFAVVAARIALGEQLLPTSEPLPFFAYPFLVATFAGWIISLLGAGSSRPRPGRRRG